MRLEDKIKHQTRTTDPLFRVKTGVLGSGCGNSESKHDPCGG